MKNKLAIFDLDGTLFKTSEVNYLAYKKALNEHGFDLSYHQFCYECDSHHYKEFLPRFSNKDEELIEAIHNRKKELYSDFLDKASVNHHLFNVIKALKPTYYIALVSNASKKNCLDVLNYFNYLDLFDYILAQDDVDLAKPNPEGFTKAMSHFGLGPRDTIIFEDSQVGIEAARACGASLVIVDKF